jgi:uncharacterized integral membrane protein (TIGR00697 family)
MNNELIFFAEIIICFTLLLGFYKIFGKTGLYIWIVLASVLANIQVVVTVALFGMVATLGNVIYGTTFLATDILSEKYGIKDARKGVFAGFLANISVLIIMQVIINYYPHPSDFMMDNLRQMFQLFPRIVAASLAAYLLSQLHDTWAFVFWKKKFPRYLWFRNNASTLVSQALDTLIFVLIAFYGVFDTGTVLGIAFSTYILKMVVALCDTPFIYLAASIKTFVYSEDK